MREAFHGFTRSFEGACTWLYLDKLGIPTTAYGNALFSTAAMCALPWLRQDGSLASRDEMIAEYSAIANLRGKRDPYGRLWTDLGGGAFLALTRLHLDSAGVLGIVEGAIARNDASLHRRYPAFDDWPACAQLAVHSLAWAAGAAYRFPLMDASLATNDFATAATQIEMTPGHNPGNDLTKRNAANEMLMRNAAAVVSMGLDPDIVEWLRPLAVTEAATQPDLDNPASSPTIYAPGIPDDVA